MTAPVSALELSPSGLIREVSPEAIKFYNVGLEGIYLPDDFRDAHADVYEVRHWSPDHRLRGKFGRFAVKYADENEQSPLDEILLMGSTIGLSGLEHGYMAMLWHADLRDAAPKYAEGRRLGEDIAVAPIDYGHTTIVVEQSGKVSLKVSGSSIDFGRANLEGRRETCALFGRLLEGAAEVINANPGPGSCDRVISQPFRDLAGDQ